MAWLYDFFVPVNTSCSEFAFACLQLEAFDSEMGRMNSSFFMASPSGINLADMKFHLWLLFLVSMWQIWISVGDVLIIRFSGDAVFRS